MNVLDWITGMSNWVSVIISALALVVSLSSFFISWRMARRTMDAQKVTAWIELGTTGTEEWFVANLSVRNQSHIDIKVQKIAIDLPDFRLGNLDEASEDDGLGNRVLPKQITVKSHCASMSLPLDVGAGVTSKAQFLIYQPARSRKRAARVSVMYWTMEPKKKWRILPVSVKTRSDL